MSYFKHCDRFEDPRIYHVRMSSLGALIKTAKFKVQAHYHFCFELKRILFSEFQLWVNCFVSCDS